MLSIAPPDDSELRSNATFEALLWAMSRPGDVRDLPQPGFAGIIEALIDLECVAFAENAETSQQLASAGAVLTHNLAEAEFVFTDSLAAFQTSLRTINCGSAFYPDDAATLVAAVAIGRGARVRLTGPGIEICRDVSMDVPEGFWAWRAQLSSYPEGFDLVLVDATSMLAIPRSTQVEVL